MKRTIYTLAMLPFIAFGVKTIALEEDASYTSQKRGYEALLVADTTSGEVPNDQVRNSLSPMYQKVYDHLTPQQQQQVRDAYTNAPNGKEADDATQTINQMMMKESKSNQTGITFEGEQKSLSPAMRADSSQPTPPQSPANRADSMSPVQPIGEDGQTPAQTASDANW